MCIIMSKPEGIAFPEENILKNCWDNNPDMGGFMYALNGEVHIKKGYETWEAFIDALNKTRAITGDNVPYVCHFRISTQGYDTSCCQPFPLTAKMKRMRKRHSEASIGVAHNGILDITSDGAKDYSDTMKFISDYLVNIIQSYDWYKNDRTKKLIENLIDGSRLAILDSKGHCELMGKGWVEENGVHYSNSTYSYKKYVYDYSKYSSYDPYDAYGDYGIDDSLWDRCWRKANDTRKEAEETRRQIGFDTGSSSVEGEISDPYEWWYDEGTGQYTFTEDMCPQTDYGDDSYCSQCMSRNECSYMRQCMKGWYPKASGSDIR